MSTKSSILAAGCALAIAACGLDVPDLNNPALDQLENHPDAVTVGAACTGLLIGDRANRATEGGYVLQLGVLGREAYNFDVAEPRYVGELIQSSLSSGSPFGGGFWQPPYANIRLANVILHATDKVPSNQLDDQAKAAIRGFVHTMQALSFLQIIVTHDTNGAVIDTDRDISQSLAPIVGKAEVYAHIVSLLDGAVPDLTAGGDAFPFALSDGYAGFTTPAKFLQFNRAIRVRVATYLGDYAKVNAEIGKSFIADAIDVAPLNFDLGVFYTYTTNAGDTANGLINPNIYAHPALQTDAETKPTGPTTKQVDLRYTHKVATASKPGANGGLTSALQFSPLYPGPRARVALIRNEELMLIKAEALWFTGQKVPAIAELNLVRQGSGGLDQLPVPADDASFVSALLYERRYSLLFEGGHRWIDLRRFHQLLPLDEKDDVRNVRYPLPLAECNARAGDPACALGSTDG
jgi:hypothetical protein